MNVDISATCAKALNLTLSSAAGGDLTLLHANTFSGVTNVTGAGTIILGNANALQSSTLNVTVAGNSVQFPVGPTPFTLGGLSGPADLVLQDTAAGIITLNIGNNGQNTQYDGVLSEVGAGGSAINKIGAGTLSLSQTPTYTGTTTVSAGTLAFDPAAGTLTFGGVIAGPGVVAATGPGALTLTNSGNTWTGGLVVSPGVTVTAGPWQTGANSPLGTGAVTLNTGSTLNLAGAGTGLIPPPFDPTQTYSAPLTIAGNSTVNVTGSAAASMGTLRIGAKLSLTGDPASSLTLGKTTLTGPATANPAANTTLTLGPIGDSPADQTLSKTGAGTLVVGAPGTFSGGTSISGPDAHTGIVRVLNNSGLGTSTITMNSGVLQLGLVPRSAIGVNIIGNIGFNAGAVGAGSVPVGDVAGVFPIPNWNNANSGGAGGAGSAPINGTQVLANFNNGNPNTGIQTPTPNVVVDRFGVATAATIAYHTSANGWSITQNPVHGDAALMNGYLDTTVDGVATATTFSIANLPYAKTDVYAYFGDADTNGRVGTGYLTQVPNGGVPGEGSAANPIYGSSNDSLNGGGLGFTGHAQATGTSVATANPSTYFFFPSVTPDAGGVINFFLLRNGGNVGFHGIEFVDANNPGQLLSASMANALTLTGDATVDVSGGTAGAVQGAFTMGSNTLFVTGQSTNPGVDPYSLRLGAATLKRQPDVQRGQQWSRRRHALSGFAERRRRRTRHHQGQCRHVGDRWRVESHGWRPWHLNPG